MTVKELLLQELEGTTDSLLLAEVLNYFRYLKFRQEESAELRGAQATFVRTQTEGTVSNTTAETALMSEPALAEDWLRPEEDEAWSHLQSDR